MTTQPCKNQKNIKTDTRKLLISNLTPQTVSNREYKIDFFADINAGVIHHNVGNSFFSHSEGLHINNH